MLNRIRDLFDTDKHMVPFILSTAFLVMTSMLIMAWLVFYDYDSVITFNGVMYRVEVVSPLGLRWKTQESFSTLQDAESFQKAQFGKWVPVRQAEKD